MIDHPLSVEQVERLSTPIDWRELSHESPVQTQIKIRRAKELKVLAVLFTKREVADRVHQLAALEHAARGAEVNNTVYSVLLRGGNPFAAQFFSHMATLSPSMDPVVDYLHASRYGKSQRGGGLKVHRKLGPDTDFSGINFALIEDTVDEGITIDRVARTARLPSRCRRLGAGITGPAANVRVITLTDKHIAELQEFDEEDVTRGFWIPNAWAGGMGLDGENEANRWIPELVLTAVQDEKYRDGMPEILEILGERAVMGIDEITWIRPKAAA